MNYRAFLAFVLLPLFSCTDDSTAENDPRAPAAEADGRSSREKPLLICTFAPTAYLTNRLVEDDAQIRLDLPADADALFWSPGRELLAAYQKADLVILNGAGMDAWAERANLPPSRTVRTTAGLGSRLLEFEGADDAHRHGDGEAHRHVGTDPHVWLDPLLALGQARAIRDALGGRIADSALEARFASLKSDLLTLNERLGRIQSSGREVLTSHPAYEYLKARYDWPLRALDLDPEAGWSPELEAAVEGALSDRGANQRATHLVWEAAPQLEVTTRLKEQFGLESWVADPGENIPPNHEEDWLDRQLVAAQVWELVLP